MPSFGDLPLWTNLLLFSAGAVVIWTSGVRLSRYADSIANRTGLGHAFIGALLLGGITSLPELATTLTASLQGSAAISVNNIFGGVAMQVTILAVADAVSRGPAIASRVVRDSALLQPALLILVLSLAQAALLVGERGFYGVGIWSTAIFVAVIVSFYLISERHEQEGWEPREDAREDETSATQDAEDGDRQSREDSTGSLVGKTCAAAAMILVAGYIIARTGEAIANQTGLGESFVGLVLIAIATSLPEVSTTLTAVRIGAFGMAFGNIFGANILDISLIFFADIAFRGGPILAEVGQFSVAAALLGILLSTLYLLGLLERRRTIVLGMGLASILVLALYAGGIVYLYSIR